MPEIRPWTTASRAPARRAWLEAMACACILLPCLVTTLAAAKTHEDHDAAAAGEPAPGRQAVHTVVVTSTDAMRFEPSSLRFVRGDVVRLRIVNSGRLPHEFVLGTEKDIRQHALMMRNMPGMEHKEANAVRVAPGATGEIVWGFSRAGTFEYACLIPGHLEAGMHGSIEVVAASADAKR